MFIQNLTNNSKYLATFLASMIFLLPNEIFPQALLVNGSQGQLAMIDLNGCEDGYISNVGNFTDIAAHPDGNIYAVNSSGELFKIDLDNVMVSAVTTLPGDFYYALTSNSDGTLFAATAGGGLVSYRPADKVLISYPNIGVGAGGDLTFYKGQLYMATNDNSIISVYPSNPSLNEVIIDFTSSNTEIFGIVSTLVNCEIRSYAISGDEFARIFEIGWEDRSFKEICTADIRVFGGSSEFEFKSSEDAFKITDFEKSNSLCEIPDVTVSIEAAGVGEDLEYSIDGINFQSSNVFEGLEFGLYNVYMRDELGCMGEDSIEILAGDLNAEIVEIKEANCGLSSGSVEIFFESNADEVNIFLNDSIVSTNVVLSGLEMGDYLLVLSDSDGCSDELNFTVDGNDPSFFTSIQIEPAKCGAFDGKIVVEASDANAVYSLGLLESTSGAFMNLEPKEYNLRMIDQNDCVVDTTVLVSALRDCNIYIPNVFSPNGDGVNDSFVVFSDKPREITSFEIFDRWGSKVFESKNYITNDFSLGWDGTINGTKAVEDIYTVHFVLKGKDIDIPYSAEFKLNR